MPGQYINVTGEGLAVYGPKSSATPQDKDNALYYLPPGRKTPEGWDCDGIYVPSDRVGDQFVGGNVGGPVAVKYIGPSVVDYVFEIKKSNEYSLPPNQGVFGPDEACCPSDYPRCVCWNIPNISQSHVTDFPEVPGHESV